MKIKIYSFLVCMLFVVSGLTTIFASADVIDQEQTEQTFTKLIYPNTLLAQSFKPDKDTLTKVELYCYGNLKCSIRLSLSSPDLRSATVNCYPEQDWFVFDFDDLDVIPDYTYVIFLNYLEDTNFGGWGATGNDKYPDGSAWVKTIGSDWEQQEGLEDFRFRTYGYNSNAPEKPTNFQAKYPTQSSIDLSWAKGSGSTHTMIRRSTGSYPDDPENSGTQVYFGTGVFHVDENLQPGTKYYYSAWSYLPGYQLYSDEYATASATTTGDDPPIEEPIVETVGVKNIKVKSATLMGKIVDDGNYGCRIRFGNKPADSQGDYVFTSWSDEFYSDGEPFEKYISGLDADTEYVFIACAKNIQYCVEGEQKDYKTLCPDIPEVSTIGPEDIKQKSAVLKGQIIEDGGDKGNCYINFKIQEYDDGEWLDHSIGEWEGPYSQGNEFTSAVNGLKPGQYYRVFAGIKNTCHTSWDATGQEFGTYLKFVHLTDPHVTADSKEVFDDVLSDVMALEELPTFVLCSGDLVEWGENKLFDNSGSENYETLLGDLNNGIIFGSKPNFYIDQFRKVPIYFCPGNHDARQKGLLQAVNPYKSLDNYKYYINSELDYTKINNNCAIISLFSGYDCIPWGGFPFPPYTTQAPGSWKISEGDGLDLFQILWLSSNLDALDNNANGKDDSDLFKIIMLHNPRVNPFSADDDEKEGVFWNYRDEFKDICNQFGVDVVVSGHIHSPVESIVTDLNGNSWSQGETMWVFTETVKDDSIFHPITLKPKMMRGELDYDIIPGDAVFTESVINIEMQGESVPKITDGQGNLKIGLNADGDTVTKLSRSHFSRWTYELINETYGIDINETITEIKLSRKLDSNFVFEIEPLEDEKVDFSVRVHLDTGDSSTAYYKDVSLDEENEIYLNCNGGIIDYHMYTRRNGNTVEIAEPYEYKGNLPPLILEKPDGPQKSVVNIDCTYTFRGADPDYQTDPNAKNIYYYIDWGDGSESEDWLGPYKSHQRIEAKHRWHNKGEWQIKVKAKDTNGLESEWSEPLTVSVSPRSRNRQLFYHDFFDFIFLIFSKLGLIL